MLIWTAVTNNCQANFWLWRVDKKELHQPSHYKFNKGLRTPCLLGFVFGTLRWMSIAWFSTRTLWWHRWGFRQLKNLPGQTVPSSSPFFHPATFKLDNYILEAIKCVVSKSSRIKNIYLSLLSYFPSMHKIASKQTRSLGSRSSW